MKKKLFIALACLAVALGATSFTTTNTDDTPFEGVVTYAITIDGNPAATKFISDSSTVQLFIKGDKSVFVFLTHNWTDTTKTLIYDTAKGTEPLAYSQIMGKKYNPKVDKPSVDIKGTDETKEIAGYSCHRVNIKVDLGDRYSNYSGAVYYTEDIPNSFGGTYGEYQSLKGLPLQFTMASNMISYTYTAISVKKQAVSNDRFAIPTGYEVMTSQQMRKSLKNSIMGKN
jgi:hypothetical protein